MLNYPTMLPLDAAQLCTEIIKQRAIQARKQEFAHAAWNVQGYIQNMTLGMPTLPGAACPDGCDCDESMEDAIYELEGALYEYENEEVQFGAEDQQESISIVTILAIASAVMQLIQMWRNRPQPENPDDLPSVG